jgi:hypothetical protein
VNYEEIKELGEELGRPIETLIVLAPINDPFYIGPARTARAEWFADICHRLEIPLECHYRRIHYRFVSQAEPIAMLDGLPYTNIFRCWHELCIAARDAIALELVPDNAFVDNRNDAPSIHLTEPEDASLGIENSHPGDFGLQMPDLPSLVLTRPTVPQAYHIEIWTEKTTMNDVLIPLARQFGMNLVTGSGELSATACRELVDRAEESERPVRILYISDFDPAGQSMPVAVARKIEFEVHRRGLDLDIQVRPVALTHDQCVEYQLPRIPIKDTERRGATFEERFGEGATELDALEALHPGLLRQILVKEIQRYHDDDHDEAVMETCRDIESKLEDVTEEALTSHRDEIAVLIEEWKEISSSYRAWLELAKPV